MCLSAYGILKLWDFGISKIKQRSELSQYINGGIFLVTCLVLAGNVATANSEMKIGRASCRERVSSPV